jgi:tetratricopeptide (TPR) repeat protein
LLAGAWPERTSAVAADRAQPASDAAAMAVRAQDLQKQGRLEEAAAEYRRFLELVPGSWEARSNLGVIHAQLGQYEMAIEQYRAVLAVRPSPAVRHNLALAFYKSARLRDAATEAEAVLKAQGDNRPAQLLLADCRLQLGEWRQVIAILDPLLEKGAEDPAVLYMVGIALMRDRQYERGQRVLDRILRRGDSAEAHLVLALASIEAKDDLSAEKELRRALELNAGLPAASALLGEVLSKQGRAVEAEAALRAELRGNPNHFDSHLLLGLLLRQDARVEEARRHLEKALVLRPGDPGARYQLALVGIAAGELEPARQALEALVREEPSFSEAHVSLAKVYYRLGRRDDGDREQALVRRLKQEEQEREDAERAERQRARPNSP